MFTNHNATTLRRLQQSWLRQAITWLVVWLIGYQLLQSVWPYADRWLIFSGLALAYCLWVLWRSLPANHRRGEDRLLPRLGPGNQLTLLRGLFIGLTAGFLFAPWPMGALAWVIVLLYTVADVADYFDGYIARINNFSTELGGRLDMEYDALGLLVVSLLGVWYGQLPWWYLSIGLARYLFVFGLWWRERRGLPVHDIPSSVHRRIVAGVQMGFMSVVLWPIAPAAGTQLVGTVIALPVLLGFLRDWLIASGRLSPDNAAYNRVRGVLYRFFARWMPLFWRAGLVVGMWAIYQPIIDWLQPAAWAALLAAWHLPAPGLLASLASLLALVGTALIALGVAGRLITLPLFFPLGFDIATRGLNWANGLAAVCTICLLILGTGPLSLWQPEAGFFARRAAAETIGDGGLAN